MWKLRIYFSLSLIFSIFIFPSTVHSEEKQDFIPSREQKTTLEKGINGAYSLIALLTMIYLLIRKMKPNKEII